MTEVSPDPMRPEASGGVPEPSGRWLRPIRIISLFLGATLVVVATLSVITRFAAQTSTETFSTGEPVSAVTVGLDSGDVQVSTAPAGSPVEVRVQRRSIGRQARYSRSVSDGTLEVKGYCTGGWLLGTCSVDLRIVLPADAALSVRTGSGDQTISGVSGQVDLSADSGNIDLTGLGGALEARTGSGDVDARGILSSGVTLESGSGNVEGQFENPARVSVGSGSGDVRIRFAQAPVEVDARTDSGNVRVEVPDDGTAYLVVGGSGSGDRQILVPTDDAGPRIEARTGSGDVRVETG